MIFSGLALYGEGEGMGSWQYSFFSSWFIPLFGNSQNMHTYHHLGMWFILLFVMVHIYTAIREDIVSRQSIISTMISGWRTFKDDARSKTSARNNTKSGRLVHEAHPSPGRFAATLSRKGRG